MSCCENSVSNDRWIIKPWGKMITHYTSDDKSVCFKTLVINCGHQISLQRHEKRSEVWWIPDENAHYELTVAEEKSILMGKRRVDIQHGYVHCIRNMSSLPLIIHEMQYGFADENDCIRIVDPYKDQR